MISGSEEWEGRGGRGDHVPEGADSSLSRGNVCKHRSLKTVGTI